MILFVTQMTVSHTMLFPVYCLLKLLNGCYSQTAFIHWLAQWFVNVTQIENDSNYIISKSKSCNYMQHSYPRKQPGQRNAGVDVDRWNKGLNLKSVLSNGGHQNSRAREPFQRRLWLAEAIDISNQSM